MILLADNEKSIKKLQKGKKVSYTALQDIMIYLNEGADANNIKEENEDA